MSTTPQCIQFGKRQIRTVIMNGVRKFSAADICNVLGYHNVSKILGRYCNATPEYIRMETVGGPQNVRMIEENDIRDILAHSRRKAAARLRQWLDEVSAPSVIAVLLEVRAK